ncbi:hypothetical protein [Erwinia billingiae]|uniref:hypothetical protein n=1 Tax=Erwinia billingiae TaxID=182337 RepID=UPI0019D01F79|nr:hypothetical protein [Erwinia billingiae]
MDMGITGETGVALGSMTGVRAKMVWETPEDGRLQHGTPALWETPEVLLTES